MCPIRKANCLNTLQRLSKSASNNEVQIALPTSVTSGRNQKKQRRMAKSNAAKNEDMAGARKGQSLQGGLSHSTRPLKNDTTHTISREHAWVRHMRHVVASILFRQRWEEQSHNSLNGFGLTRKVQLLMRVVALALVVLTLRDHTCCNVRCC